MPGRTELVDALGGFVNAAALGARIFFASLIIAGADGDGSSTMTQFRRSSSPFVALVCLRLTAGRGVVSGVLSSWSDTYSDLGKPPGTLCSSRGVGGVLSGSSVGISCSLHHVRPI